jgi:hypothetical protein
MDIEWRLGIGDPTFVGWLIVAMYIVASAACFLAANGSQFSGRNWRSDGTFWLLIALLFSALGINKQLDLQSLFTELGRELAKNGGWYAQRRAFQAAFIASIALASAVSAAFLMLWAKRLGRAQVAAMLGTCFVLAFVVIRAASFHHIDAFLARSIFGAKWNWVFEIAGISVVSLAAISYSKRIESSVARRLFGRLPNN